MQVHVVRDYKSASSCVIFCCHQWCTKQGTCHPKSDANSIKLMLIHVLNYCSLLLDCLGSFIEVLPDIGVKRAIVSLKKLLDPLLLTTFLALQWYARINPCAIVANRRSSYTSFAADQTLSGSAILFPLCAHKSSAWCCNMDGNMAKSVVPVVAKSIPCFCHRIAYKNH